MVKAVLSPTIHDCSTGDTLTVAAAEAALMGDVACGTIWTRQMVTVVIPTPGIPRTITLLHSTTPAVTRVVYQHCSDVTFRLHLHSPCTHA